MVPLTYNRTMKLMNSQNIATTADRLHGLPSMGLPIVINTLSKHSLTHIHYTNHLKSKPCLREGKKRRRTIDEMTCN